MHSSSAALKVSGTVTFEQAEDDSLAPMTVTVNINGLSPGLHGFHVHQFGDVREVSDLSTMGAHFVPFCIPPEIQPGVTDLTNGCINDQKHGWPPSEIRQPGDMGNITVTAAGTVTQVLTIGQRKMSLTDSLRSIIGRVVVVHTSRDDGSQPYGNAGLPQAYGVIGIAKPNALSTTNNALAPTTPKVDKVICTFEEPHAGEGRVGSQYTIYGQALLTLQEPEQPGMVRMQATLQGLQRDSEHSFHFHEWGDLRQPMDQLGNIYYSNAIDPHEINVQATGTALFDSSFASDSLKEHVGRMLTIHEGPTSSTPTIAAAVCGLSNPKARIDTHLFNTHQGGSPLSSTTIALTVVTVLVVSSVLLVGILYFFRCPIPFCGSMLYGGNEFSSLPPPPPKAMMPDVPPPPPPPA